MLGLAAGVLWAALRYYRYCVLGTYMATHQWNEVLETAQELEKTGMECVFRVKSKRIGERGQ